MQEIDKLAWLHLKDKRILVARSKNKTIYYIPGGKRDPGESDQEALIREIKEELSVDILPHTIQYANTFTAPAHDKTHDTAVKMTCFFADYQGILKADAEIEEIAWFAFSEKDKCSPATQLIMDWLNSEGKLN